MQKICLNVKRLLVNIIYSFQTIIRVEERVDIRAWIKTRVQKLHSDYDEQKSDLLVPLKDAGAITRWLNDRAEGSGKPYPPPNPEIETIDRLAQHFGMSVFEFFLAPNPTPHGNDDLIQDLRLVLSHSSPEVIAIVRAAIKAASRPIRQSRRVRDGTKKKAG